MLHIGIIGYGNRISNMAKRLQVFNIPYQVTAVADPRYQELQATEDEFLTDAAFYGSADELLAHSGELDGVMIGTRCLLHTEMACKVVPTGLPLFLEKPVAINFAQVRQLDQAFQNYAAPTVVSFPLRLSPVVQKVKEIIDSGQIGSVENVVAWCNVPYGSGYFRSWHRNFDQNGGLFLQKATHDLDNINYLLGQRPKWISAMNARRVYGGDMPFDLKCQDCHLRETCTESPFVRFHTGFENNEVLYRERGGYCVFSKGFEIEDMGSCLIEYEGGPQVSYTQNFFTRYQASQRGARIYGYKGTIEFDWYRNQVKVFSHVSPTVETIDFAGDMPHFGGDRELCYDFLMAMRDGTPTRSPIDAGILSALTCLWAREAARSRRVCEVKIPDPAETPAPASLL
ncbi:MAG: Gfo/Idh/MocA family oxidoreductase [Caldilineaceae bacterium]|nr:Gfo/Idh/MocA family oxidoreductase [Caldilineaceae bacterium]